MKNHSSIFAPVSTETVQKWKIQWTPLNTLNKRFGALYGEFVYYVQLKDLGKSGRIKWLGVISGVHCIVPGTTLYSSTYIRLRILHGFLPHIQNFCTREAPFLHEWHSHECKNGDSRVQKFWIRGRNPCRIRNLTWVDQLPFSKFSFLHWFWKNSAEMTVGIFISAPFFQNQCRNGSR